MLSKKYFFKQITNERWKNIPCTPYEKGGVTI